MVASIEVAFDDLQGKARIGKSSAARKVKSGRRYPPKVDKSNDVVPASDDDPSHSRFFYRDVEDEDVENIMGLYENDDEDAPRKTEQRQRERPNTNPDPVLEPIPEGPSVSGFDGFFTLPADVGQEQEQEQSASYSSLEPAQRNHVVPFTVDTDIGGPSVSQRRVQGEMVEDDEDHSDLLPSSTRRKLEKEERRRAERRRERRRMEALSGQCVIPRHERPSSHPPLPLRLQDQEIEGETTVTRGHSAPQESSDPASGGTHALEIGLFLLAGILFIFVLEQFVQIGVRIGEANARSALMAASYTVS